MADKETVKEVVEKLWPKAKKELDTGINNAKKIIAQSEKYFTELSKKGAAQTKKISLSLKREKAYYDLGKVIAATTSSQWKTNNKIISLIKEIKKLDKNISKAK